MLSDVSVAAATRLRENCSCSQSTSERRWHEGARQRSVGVVMSAHTRAREVNFLVLYLEGHAKLTSRHRERLRALQSATRPGEGGTRTSYRRDKGSSLAAREAIKCNDSLN